MGVAAIANDGKRMQPYIVSKVVGADDKTDEFSPIIVEQVVKPETAAQVTGMMNKVYLGTLIESRFKGLSKYNIAVKSGTALIPYRNRAGYSNEINATYVGFDASPKKTFVLLIKLEEPQNGDLSFNNTRILWLDTFVAIKDYLAVPEFQN
jgi:cell division protein FtsI/penicillin-binding protein 2